MASASRVRIALLSCSLQQQFLFFCLNSFLESFTFPLPAARASVARLSIRLSVWFICGILFLIPSLPFEDTRHLVIHKINLTQRSLISD
ncbi:hypothetical protein IQ07DRAFT_192669 [Pyrenochaeta sp. DS3sAY3a]|nr:hypothetical protein IQ07DRAFT_192669 [Pyrenochaeta sp. DS3sAY3a]